MQKMNYLEYVPNLGRMSCSGIVNADVEFGLMQTVRKQKMYLFIFAQMLYASNFYI